MTRPSLMAMWNLPPWKDMVPRVNPSPVVMLMAARKAPREFMRPTTDWSAPPSSDKSGERAAYATTAESRKVSERRFFIIQSAQDLLKFFCERRDNREKIIHHA